MFTIVAVNFEAFQDLPPFEFKLMAALLRYVNRQGECCPALHQLAADVLASEATVSRSMTRLQERGCFTRERQGNGRYLYRVAERYLARQTLRKFALGCRKDASIEAAFRQALGEAPNLPPIGARPTDSHLAAVQDGLSHGARQEVTPSGSKDPSGEQQPSQQDEIPVGWEEAAAAERRLAGLGAVNLRVEWRKLVAYSEGARITIWRWRGWVLKARCGESPEWQLSKPTAPKDANLATLGGDEREQRQARDWARRGFWLRDGSWGPAPDQPGCQLPAGLIAWAIGERQARAA